MRLGLLHYTHVGHGGLGSAGGGTARRECCEASRLKGIREDGGGSILDFADGTWAWCAEPLAELAARYEALVLRALNPSSVVLDAFDRGEARG